MSQLEEIQMKMVLLEARLSSEVARLQDELRAARSLVEKQSEDLEAAQRGRTELQEKVEEQQNQLKEISQRLLRTEEQLKEGQLGPKEAPTSIPGADNAHTRSVAWRLNGFYKKLLPLVVGETDRGIVSPPFSLCCLPAMQLEIRLAARGETLDTAPPEGTVPYGPGQQAPRPSAPPLPLPSSCTLRLWGPPGLSLVFEVTLGEGMKTVTRRFEHVFRPLDDADIGCCLMSNFCPMDQVWIRDADSIQVALEILEFRMAPFILELPAPPLPTKDLDVTANPKAPEEPNEFNKKGTQELMFFRSATCEQLVLERMTHEFVTLKNRSVRRIEWRLESCSRLLELCRPGEVIESPLFSAGGLDRLQLFFFPRGNDTNAPAGIQPCALFVSGPYRTTLRGVLWVGANARQFEHHFQRRGELGGRARFGSLNSQLDSNDTVLLALDISEVETEVPEQSASLVIREVQAAAKDPTSPGGGNGALSFGAPSPTKAKGIVKMKREDPAKTEEIVKCVSLPTLNARHLSTPLTSGKSRRMVDMQS